MLIHALQTVHFGSSMSRKLCNIIKRISSKNESIYESKFQLDVMSSQLIPASCTTDTFFVHAGMCILIAETKGIITIPISLIGNITKTCDFIHFKWEGGRCRINFVDKPTMINRFLDEIIHFHEHD